MFEIHKLGLFCFFSSSLCYNLAESVDNFANFGRRNRLVGHLIHATLDAVFGNFTHNVSGHCNNWNTSPIIVNFHLTDD